MDFHLNKILFGLFVLVCILNTISAEERYCADLSWYKEGPYPYAPPGTATMQEQWVQLSCFRYRYNSSVTFVDFDRPVRFQDYEFSVTSPSTQSISHSIDNNPDHDYVDNAGQYIWDVPRKALIQQSVYHRLYWTNCSGGADFEPLLESSVFQSGLTTTSVESLTTVTSTEYISRLASYPNMPSNNEGRATTSTYKRIPSASSREVASIRVESLLATPFLDRSADLIHHFSNKERALDLLHKLIQFSKENHQ